MIKYADDMLDSQPSTPPSNSFWKNRNFYRGVLLVPVLMALGFFLLVAIKPPPQTGLWLQISFGVALLIAAIMIQFRFKQIGLGMLIGWLMFFAFPVAWVLLLGFTGNLM